MNNDELKKWLRDNSSGVYRSSRMAADVIERLERENARLRREIEKTAYYLRERGHDDWAESLELLLPPNVKDEPRRQTAGWLLRSQHDGWRRWLWRLVRPFFPKSRDRGITAALKLSRASQRSSASAVQALSAALNAYATPLGSRRRDAEV